MRTMGKMVNLMKDAIHTGNGEQRSSLTATERDGLQENIMQLNDLSEKINRYFALPVLGELPEKVSDYDNKTALPG